MVQDGNFYAPRGYWPQEKSLVDEARYNDTGEGKTQGRIPTIPQALRDHCKINARKYFLATIDDDGMTNVFSSEYNKTHTADFFNEEGFKRAMERATTFDMHPSTLHDFPLPYGDSSHQSFGVDNRWPQRNYGRELALDDGRPRKRYRSETTYRDSSATIEEAPVKNTVSSQRGIEIGNEAELWIFYEQRFKDCQQTACKLIAKAWIKTVEPKKQSTHPYTGSDERAPAWWPQPWGQGSNDRVRHKEPDHLLKKERVHLLKHILGMIILPTEQQHDNIKHLSLNVKKLEEVTWEALSGFFADKENSSSNGRKKKYLEDIFRVAKYHQRYKNDEIDPATMVWVGNNDKDPEDPDVDNQGFSPFKDEDEQEYGRHSSSISPAKGSTPHSLVAHHDFEHAGTGHLQGGSYPEETSARGSYSHQSLLSGMPSDQGQYVDTGMAAPAHLTPGGFMYASHDSSRRGSIFSPSDYTSPSTSLYSTWSQSTTAPSGPSLFAYTTQPNSGAQPHYLDQSPGQLGQSQQYVASEFDGLPRGGADFGSHMMHRGSLPSQTFPYLSSMSDNQLKVETIPRITQP